MSKKYYEKRAFLKLQQSWYDKLKKSGFHDIEHIDFNTGEVKPLLKSKTVRSVSELSRRRDSFESDRDYFHWAGQFYWYLIDQGEVNEYVCEMWRMWADGHSISNIHRIMGRPRNTVSKAIKQLNKEMDEWLRYESEE